MTEFLNNARRSVNNAFTKLKETLGFGNKVNVKNDGRKHKRRLKSKKPKSKKTKSKKTKRYLELLLR